MPTPEQIKTAKDHANAAHTLAAIDSLERCRGFTDWLAPKLFKAYDTAGESILAAHARGEAPNPSDVATYHGLHEIVAACRRDKVTAAHKLKSSI
jgi:hypothetical protein